MIGILSDAHGNAPAFDQAVRLLKKIGVERFVFLGDAVGYIPLRDVIKSLQKLDLKIQCVRGNHENMLLQGICDAEREDVYKLSVVRSTLEREELDFLQKWPTHHVETVVGKRLLFVHGSPSDYINGYMYIDTDLSMFDESSDFVFIGHSHHPFVRHHGRVCYVNVGSCGMPRDDGRFGAAATFDPESGLVRIVRFDITEATRKALWNASGVHASVKAIFARRKTSVYGDFL
ncbi:uncharacterized conserved protein [Candidatus Vecturithrix granuli]|uniref:Uncharacterized conserved protein n=1 Tax=Vecturithrix granuli TaxID=1499967 RepID=A0A081C7V6_VECG1|nr:uncharacterized conserved protein [Candidatus Vecturithrix granuli]